MKQISNRDFYETARMPDLLKAINRFAVPLMLTGIIQLLYNAADSAIVGRFAGSEYLAAVGSTTTVVFLLITLFNGISVGAGYLVAHRFGADDREGVSDAVHCAVFLAVLMGLCAGTFGFFVSGSVLRLVEVPEDVLPLSTLYLKIYFVGVPFLVIYNFGAAILRAVKDTRFPLYVIVSTGLLNVGLNVLLVVRYDMNVAGVAIATTVAQGVSAAAVLLRLIFSRDSWKLYLKKIRPIRAAALEMIRVGLAAGLQGVVFSIANVLVQSRVNTFQAAAMAGNAAANSLEGFIHTAQNAYYQAAITFTSQAMGAKQKKQVIPIFWACILSGTVLGWILCALLAIFREQLLHIYIKRSDPNYAAVMEAGFTRVRMIGRFQWVGGLMEMTCGSLRGLGMTTNPTATTLLGSCATRVIWIFTVFSFFRTLQSLYIVYPISWILTFSVHIFFLLRWKKQAFGTIWSVKHAQHI